VKSIFLLAIIPVAGQSVSVYSEFARIDASGQVTAPAEPREILSPAVVRNGFTSFQIVVRVERGSPFWLYIGENPERATRVTLYRENGDHLEPVEIPHDGDSTEVLWLDVWVDRNAPVRRIKIEPQLKVDREWATPYPMEVRVVDATVPEGPREEGFQTPAALVRKFLCGADDRSANVESDVARKRFRNAQQDIAMSARAPKEDLRGSLGGCEAIPSADPEVYLHFRDYLFRMR
jgi:hypothetical protein